MSSLTVQDKILLHLSKYRAYREKIAVPTAITQDGIADAIGIKRPHVSVEIKRMMKKGLIEEFKAHAGGTKRRKAYFTTALGMEKVNNIEEWIRKRRVILDMDEDEREVNGEEAVTYLSGYMGLPYCIAAEIVAESHKISPELITERKEKREKTIYSSPIPEVSEIFGREKETDLMERWYKRKSTTLAIVGTAGIGKTSLAASFVSRLRSPVFWQEIEEWETVRGIMESLSDFLTKNGRNELMKYLSGRDIDLGLVAKIIQNIDDKQIWIFDNYQKASEDVKKIFGMLNSVLKKTPVRMIVISRSIPDFYGRRDAIKGDVQELFLGGISEDAAREFLVSKGLYVSEGHLREVYSFTKGHPLTLEMGSLSGMRKGVVKAYLNEEFYNRLKPAEREMLSSITVHRKGAPAEAFVRTEKDIETLKSLVKKGLVHYDTEETYFVHDIIRDLFARKRDQKKDHMMAFGYHSLAEDIGGKIEALYHLLMAEKYEMAERLSLRIIDEAISKGKANEILSVLNQRESEHPGLLISKGEALRATGNLKEAEKILKKVLKTEGARVSAMNALARVYNAAGEQEKAKEVLEKVDKMEKSDELAAEMEYTMGMVLDNTDDYEHAKEHLKKAVELYEKIGDAEKKARAESELAKVFARNEDINAAVKILERLVGFFEEREEYRLMGVNYHNLAIYQSYLGLREKARESFEKATLYAEISGHMQLIAYSMMNSADNYLRLGDPEKALYMAEKAEKMLEKIGDKRGLAILKTVIAGAHHILGDDFEKYYNAAEKALKEQGLNLALGEMYEEWAGRCRDVDRKRELYRKALEIFRETDYTAGIEKLEKEMNEEAS